MRALNELFYPPIDVSLNLTSYGCSPASGAYILNVNVFLALESFCRASTMSPLTYACDIIKFTGNFSVSFKVDHSVSITIL